MNKGSRAWVPVTHMGDLDGVSGLWLGPSSTLAVTGVCGVNLQMEDCSIMSQSKMKINKHWKNKNRSRKHISILKVTDLVCLWLLVLTGGQEPSLLHPLVVLDSSREGHSEASPFLQFLNLLPVSGLGSRLVIQSASLSQLQGHWEESPGKLSKAASKHTSCLPPASVRRP